VLLCLPAGAGCGNPYALTHALCQGQAAHGHTCNLCPPLQQDLTLLTAVCKSHHASRIMLQLQRRRFILELQGGAEQGVVAVQTWNAREGSNVAVGGQEGQQWAVHASQRTAHLAAIDAVPSAAVPLHASGSSKQGR
jgi:hypothetical protein